MLNAPFMFDYQNAITSLQKPGIVHSQNTGLARFFQRYLLQKAISVFKWEMPESWAEDFVKYVLYCQGYFCIINTDKFGVIAQNCGLYGYDVYYRPTHVVIANPLIKQNLRPKIGVDCALIKLQPDYGGIWDIITYYADLMAVASESAGVNLVNSKLSYVLFAKNKAFAETLKQIYDDIAGGKPAVATDKNLLDDQGQPSWMAFDQNVGQNFIVDKLLDCLRMIENMFDTDIGIPNANTEKKERLLTDEVNANNVETFAKCSLWLDELQKGISIANDMFGLNLSVDWRIKPQEGGTDYGKHDSIDLGNL